MICSKVITRNSLGLSVYKNILEKNVPCYLTITKGFKDFPMPPKEKSKFLRKYIRNLIPTEFIFTITFPFESSNWSS